MSKSLQQIFDLASKSKELTTTEFLCGLMVAVITIIIYSAIIWLLWNSVLTRAFAGVKPISILQALGIKILFDLLF